MIMVNNRIGLVSVLLALCLFFSPVIGWDNINYAYRVPLETNGTLYIPYSLNDSGRVLYNVSGSSYESVLFTNASYIYQNDTDISIRYNSSYINRLYYDASGADIGYDLLQSDYSLTGCAGCDAQYNTDGVYVYEDDLVAYYHLDTFRNETVTDSSIYGNDGSRYGNMSGTLSGPPTWTSTCKYNGNCLGFDGVNDYVNITDIIGMVNTGGTVSLWSNSQGDSSGNFGFMFGHRTGTDNNRINIFRHDIDNELYFGFANTALIATNYVIPSDEWHYYTFTWNGANYATYIDGVANVSGTLITPSSIDPYAYIGTSGSDYFNGSIDSVRIWDKALNQTEIQMEMVSSLPVETDGLVTSFEFEEGTGTTTYQTGYTSDSKIGSAMYFDGVDDYVDCGSDVSITGFDIADNFSSCMWLKTDEYSVDQGILGESQSSGDYTGWTITFNDWFSGNGGSVILINLRDDSSKNIERYTSADYDDGNWHHVCFTYNGSNTKSGLLLYVDGLEPSTTALSSGTIISIDSGQNVITGSTNKAVNFFNGSIDEVMIYNRSLSAAEISQIYKNGVDQFSTIGTLENLWYYNVTDSADNNIDNVTLTVYNQTNNIVYTTTDGTFELVRQNLPTGSLTLLFQVGGYQSETETLTNTDQYIFRTIQMQRSALNITIYDYYENQIEHVPIDIKITNSTNTFYYGYGHSLEDGTINDLVDNNMSSYDAFDNTATESGIILLPLRCGQNTTIYVSADNINNADGMLLKAYNVNTDTYDTIFSFAPAADSGQKTYNGTIDNSACAYNGKVKLEIDTPSDPDDLYVYEVWVNQLSQPISLDQDLLNIPTGDITITLDDIDVLDSYVPAVQTTTFSDSIITKKFYLFKETESTSILFTTIDSTNNNPIPAVDITLQIYMSDTWTTFTQGTTDDTGSLTLYMKTDISTNVIATKTGYTKDPFTFTPTISTGIVSIPMDPDYALNYTYILQGIIYRFEPADTILAGTETTNLSFFISSAGATIDSITYNVTWNGTLIGEETSTSSSGATLTIAFNASDRTGDVESNAYIIINGTLLELNISYAILTITSGNWTFADLKTKINDETLTNQRFIGVMAAIILMAAVSGFAGVMHYGAGLVLLGLVGLLTALGFLTYMQYAIIIGLAFGIYILLRGL